MQVDALTPFVTRDDGEVVGAQREVENVGVLDQPGSADSFGEDNESLIKVPADRNLSQGFAVFRGDLA